MSHTKLSQGAVGDGARLRNYLAGTQTIQKLSELKGLENEHFCVCDWSWAVHSSPLHWKIDGFRVLFLLYFVCLFVFLVLLLCWMRCRYKMSIWFYLVLVHFKE